VQEIKANDYLPHGDNHYHHQEEEYWTDQAIKIASLLRYVIPTLLTARALVDGRKDNDEQDHSTHTTPTTTTTTTTATTTTTPFLYRLDVPSPLLGGSGHGMDIPYVFGTYKGFYTMVPPRGNKKLKEAVMNAWTNFAKTGDPNKGTIKVRRRVRGDVAVVVVVVIVVVLRVLIMVKHQSPHSRPPVTIIPSCSGWQGEGITPMDASERRGTGGGD